MTVVATAKAAVTLPVINQGPLLVETVAATDETVE